MEKAFESRPNTLNRPPWHRPLLHVAHGADDLWEYTIGGRPVPGYEVPPVSGLAVLMIRTALQMLLWRYPEGPVEEAVNVVGDLPDKLERLIEDELKGLLEGIL